MSEAPTIDFPADQIQRMAGIEEIATAIMTEGHTMGDFMGITSDEMDATYAHGISLLNLGQFDEAEDIFKLGAELDMYDERMWMGLGAARQKNGNFAGAVDAYAVAVTLTPDNPVIALRSAECLIADGRKEQAEQALHACLAFAEEEPQHADIQSRAEALLANL
ncbi:MAG: SycD/LcrH family type III secretion system chaperone [Planctomycetota bacterium]